MSAALELAGVSQHFGALKAVDEVTFSVEPGARHAVIGPNGAGKSTLFGAIGGLRVPTHGSVRVHGSDVTRLSEHRRVHAGIARTFQHSSLFLDLTVRDNVVMAVQNADGSSGRIFPSARLRRAHVEHAHGILDMVHLVGRAGDVVSSLSHGERRQLEVAVALACDPKLLLMDEPAAGMSAAETGRLAELIRGLPSEITVMLVEHDLDLVFDVATTVTVMHLGRHLITGSLDEVRGSDEVRDAYLGAAMTEDLFFDEGDAA